MPKLPASPAALPSAAVALLFLCAPANAHCVSATIPVNYCDKCVTTGTIKVLKNQTCTRPLHSMPVHVTVVGSKVVRQPKKGRLGVGGADYAYVPARDYVGKDDFAFTTTFMQGTQPLTITVEIAVDVVAQ